MADQVAPEFTDLIGVEAEESWSTPYGTTARVFSDRGFEVVCVIEDQEEIDPGGL